MHPRNAQFILYNIHRITDLVELLHAGSKIDERLGHIMQPQFAGVYEGRAIVLWKIQGTERVQQVGPNS